MPLYREYEPAKYSEMDWEEEDEEGYDEDSWMDEEDDDWDEVDDNLSILEESE